MSAGVKAINQDRLAAHVPAGVSLEAKGAIFAVADGISSSSISQDAAETALTSFVADYYATPEAWSTKTSARRVIQAVNSWLYAQNRYARTTDMNHGLVCTLSVLIIKAREAHIFHIGDSRIARLIGGDAEPLTTDHVTVVSESEQYLGRALGVREFVDIDYLRVPVNAGDMFILSTDGLHEHLDSASYKGLSTAIDLQSKADQLVARALQAGSQDNLTAQLVRVVEIPTHIAPPHHGQGELPLPPELSPGERLDEYALLREVHNTGRSKLFRATDALDNAVAIKTPGFEMRDNPEQLHRFVFEEWIASRLRSPHVVKAAPSSLPRSSSYVALEWIEGVTLRQWMHDNPTPTLDEVRRVLEQICKGLRALHRREMIHQDLRPENVMLNSDGTAVIIDLGSVAVAGLEESAPALFGLRPGTFQYTAPEYLSGDLVSWRSDQFSLAVIAYEMLTGKLPYGASAGRVRSRRDQQRLRYVSALENAPNLLPWVDFALRRACHRDPLRRYDALSEFLVDMLRPNSEFKQRHALPLVERNPVVFWRSLAFTQAMVLLGVFLYWLGLP